MENFNKETEFRKLYEEHWHHLFAYVYNIIADQAKSEDIVQDIFLNLWNRFEAIEIKQPRAYLLQAARFQCAHYFRTKKFTHVQLDVVSNMLQKHDLNFSADETAELVAHITTRADSLLPEKCKEVFKLRFYHQLSNKEIATELGLSVSTVENQVNKALRLLRFSFNQQASALLILSALATSLP